MKDQLIVFVRIALYALAGYAVQGGWMPQALADQLTDPATVEVFTALILGAGTFIWYMFSKSRKALREAAR